MWDSPPPWIIKVVQLHSNQLKHSSILYSSPLVLAVVIDIEDLVVVVVAWLVTFGSIVGEWVVVVVVVVVVEAVVVVCCCCCLDWKTVVVDEYKMEECFNWLEWSWTTFIIHGGGESHMYSYTLITTSTSSMCVLLLIQSIVLFL